MANRNAAAAWISEIVKTANRPIHLVAYYFDAATVYQTDAYRAVSYGGNSYTAQGHLLGIGRLEETAQPIVQQVQLTLAGADQQWISNVLNNRYTDRRLRIWKGFIGSGEALIDPNEFFDGYMDDATIEEDPDAGESVVVIVASRKGADVQRKPGRHTSDAEQQVHFPGDTIFSRVTGIAREIHWGRATP